MDNIFKKRTDLNQFNTTDEYMALAKYVEDTQPVKYRNSSDKEKTIVQFQDHITDMFKYTKSSKCNKYNSEDESPYIKSVLELDINNFIYYNTNPPQLISSELPIFRLFCNYIDFLFFKKYGINLYTEIFNKNKRYYNKEQNREKVLKLCKEIIATMNDLKYNLITESKKKPIKKLTISLKDHIINENYYQDILINSFYHQSLLNEFEKEDPFEVVLFFLKVVKQNDLNYSHYLTEIRFSENQYNKKLFHILTEYSFNKELNEEFNNKAKKVLKQHIEYMSNYAKNVYNELLRYVKMATTKTNNNPATMSNPVFIYPLVFMGNKMIDEILLNGKDYKTVCNEYEVTTNKLKNLVCNECYKHVLELMDEYDEITFDIIKSKFDIKEEKLISIFTKALE